jgi:hypothetical protein
LSISGSIFWARHVTSLGSRSRALANIERRNDSSPYAAVMMIRA